MGNSSASKMLGAEKFKGDMIVIFGLYDTGKKTFVDKFNEKVNLSASDDGMTKYATFRNIKIFTTDYGGRCFGRAVLPYQKMGAIIIMIDSADGIKTDDFGYADDKYQLMTTARDVAMVDAPILVLANKQDLPGAKSVQQIEEELGLIELKQKYNKRAIEIMPVSALKEEGMWEAMEWIQHQLQLKHARDALVKPLEKAMPPCLPSFYNSVSSALKQTFGRIRKS